MARIKIEDLPVLENLSPKEKKKTLGGATLLTSDNTYEYVSYAGDGDRMTLAESSDDRTEKRLADGSSNP